ncbi:MAG: diacylglycerol kinase family protein [Bacteroidales bacterium]|nr:diacylglycerol kinase family protein [Bacteroidales bacterium]
MNNSSQNKFSIKKRIQSFRYAFRGIGFMFKTQHNSQIHLVAAIIVVVFGFILNVSLIEWCLLIFAIGLVITAELINTSIEYLVDICSPEFNERAGKAKDIAAGAVLVAAIISAIIGLIIFLPKLFV